MVAGESPHGVRNGRRTADSPSRTLRDSAVGTWVAKCERRPAVEVGGSGLHPLRGAPQNGVSVATPHLNHCFRILSESSTRLEDEVITLQLVRVEEIWQPDSGFVCS